MIWFAYLSLYFPMFIIAMLVTPVLPLFKEYRLGLTNNGTSTGWGWRLPAWAAWFDTPDNPITGTYEYMEKNGSGHWAMVRWLYRNTLYGLKNGAMSVVVRPSETRHRGNPKIDKNNPANGFFFAHGCGWQLKLAMPIWPGRRLVANLGWQLDTRIADWIAGPAMFMNSIRLPRAK